MPPSTNNFCGLMAPYIPWGVNTSIMIKPAKRQLPDQTGNEATLDIHTKGFGQEIKKKQNEK